MHPALIDKVLLAGDSYEDPSWVWCGVVCGHGHQHNGKQSFSIIYTLYLIYLSKLVIGHNTRFTVQVKNAGRSKYIGF